MSEQTLASFAILSVNWNQGHDALESFVPIVADCIRRNGGKAVSLVELQNAVEQEAGIRIPSGALQAILGRCAKRKLVRRRHNVYEPDLAKLEELDYAADRADVVRRHGALLTKLKAYALERYEVEWTDEQAERNLIAFLKQGSVPVLMAATEGDPLPGGREQNRKAKHILGNFVLHLEKEDAEGFSCLEVVVKGFVLSGVLFYPDLGRLDAKLGDLDVYCDTPFLLDALGYNEEGVRVQAVDLLELLRDLGAQLRCFHHTREELAGVLEAEAGSLRRGGNGSHPTYPGRGLPLQDIQDMLVTIDQTLLRLGIKVVDTPDWKAEPDEMTLNEVLGRSIYYPRERAKEKDVQSLAAVARLRSMTRMDSFESAKAIFVTTNTALARTSSKFFEVMERPNGIPLCVPVETMTRLAWVKKPLSAPDLPRHMVIASSYAALNPPPALWRTYLKEIERRRGKGELQDSEYYLLRSSREAREALMDETMGEENAFSAGTLDEVLDHAKAAIRAEADERTASERERADRAEAEAKRALARAEGLQQVHRDEVDLRATRVGAAAGNILAVAVVPILAVGLLATIPGFPLIEITSPVLRVAVWICVLAFVVISFYGLFVKQMSVPELREALSSEVRRRVAKRGHEKLDVLHGKNGEADKTAS